MKPVRIINFGSLNLDLVYRVPHLAKPGETLSSTGREVFPGGKGLNQSVALSRAGAQVLHAGCVGGDGESLVRCLRENGVNTDLIQKVYLPTGHAVIQVEDSGQNCILLCPGANHALTEDYIRSVLAPCRPGDWLLLQNETNAVDRIFDLAGERGLKIAWNPSPMEESLTRLPRDAVACLFVNETEGEAFTGEKEPKAILSHLAEAFPRAITVLTLGEAGSMASAGGDVFFQPAYPVLALDTTAAGDTFTGYFLTALLEGQDIPACLRLASAAAALAVTRSGAAPSIPLRVEAEAFQEREYQ